MNTIKMHAIDVLRKYQDHMPSSDYQDIMAGLTEIELLRDRDEELEVLWDQFLEIPFDPESDEIQTSFHGWGKGIKQSEIVNWFEARHSNGVTYLFIRSRKECKNHSCRHHSAGKCLFPLVYKRKPRITEEGCIDFDFCESEEE